MNRQPEHYRVKKASAQNRTGRPAPNSAPPTPSLEEKRRRERERREAILQAKKEAARQRALRRERRRRLFRLSFTMGCVFFCLYWCIVAVSVATRANDGKEALPLLLYTEGERSDDGKYEPEQVVRSGKVYLPVTALEKYMAISHFGDFTTRSFLICDSGDYATFYPGTPHAIVNGVRVNLKENVLLIDDVLYLPIDFYTDKMNCFTFTESAPLAAYVLTYNKADPGMRFSLMEDSLPVDVATVPAPVPSVLTKPE